MAWQLPEKIPHNYLSQIQIYIFVKRKVKKFSFLKIWFEKVLWMLQNVPFSRWLLISFFPFEASRMIFSDVRIQINYNVLPRAHPSGMYFQLGFRQSYWRDCRRFGIHSCKKGAVWIIAILRNIQYGYKTLSLIGYTR